jgi:hypothetical protein
MRINQVSEIPSEQKLHIVDGCDGNVGRVYRSARRQSAVSEDSSAQSDRTFGDFKRWKRRQQL